MSTQVLSQTAQQRPMGNAMCSRYARCQTCCCHLAFRTTLANNWNCKVTNHDSATDSVWHDFPQDRTYL